MLKFYLSFVQEAYRNRTGLGAIRGLLTGGLFDFEGFDIWARPAAWRRSPRSRSRGSSSQTPTAFAFDILRSCHTSLRRDECPSLIPSSRIRLDCSTRAG